MNTINIVVIAIVIVFFVWRMMPVKGVKNISTKELKNLLKEKDKQFIDVRTPGEYKSNHIREFNNFPLHTLSTTAAKLSKEKEVIVICQSGMRSSKASKQLKAMGFKNITNVKGGMSAWN